MTETCPLCANIAGRSSTPGGIIHDDGCRLVVHQPGPQSDPGELFVILRRHAESIGTLTASEAASLGPLLRAGVSGIERVVAPERVYTGVASSPSAAARGDAAERIRAEDVWRTMHD